MSLFGQSNTAGTSTANTQGDTKGDVEVANPPKDSVTDIAFSPAAAGRDYLATGAWDNTVLIYEVPPNGQAVGKCSFTQDRPIFSVAWGTDGTKLFAGCADNFAYVYDLQAGATAGTKIAQHDNAIKSVRTFHSAGNDYIVTGGWDGRVKIWDQRQQTPIINWELPNSKKVYTMDLRNELLVVGTEDRQIHMYALRNPPSLHKTITSPLKWQTRVVSCFTDATGFAVGSIEGRCAIQYAEDKDNGLNFSFKCHRQQDPNNRDVAKVYSVNAISFHPVHGTFSTAGSDGTFHFWDKDAKHRLKGYPEVGGSISSTAFNHNGTIFAYAVSYDWSKGYGHNTQNYPNKIMLHPIVGDECKPRPGSKKR